MTEHKFEAHITFDRKFAHFVEAYAPTVGWTYSVIDGDPVMGQKAYCYLTAYDTNPLRLKRRALEIAERLGRIDIQVPALRTKVEQIMWDSKTGHDVVGTPRHSFGCPHDDTELTQPQPIDCTCDQDGIQLRIDDDDIPF